VRSAALLRSLPCDTDTWAIVVRIKKSGKVTKFKVRCSKYLYTLAVNDAEKAEKLRLSMPPGNFSLHFHLDLCSLFQALRFAFPRFISRIISRFGSLIQQASLSSKLCNLVFSILTINGQGFLLWNLLAFFILFASVSAVQLHALIGSEKLFTISEAQPPVSVTQSGKRAATVRYSEVSIG
jgi:hypothetical protein